jgi:hypothetical protein
LCVISVIYIFASYVNLLLGLPFEKDLRGFLDQKEDTHEFHKNRQKNRKYKATVKSKAEATKRRQIEEEKISKKRGHTYDEKKELYPAKKKRKVCKHEQEDKVFGVFGQGYYYGIILEEGTHEVPYVIRFIDGEVLDVDEKKIRIDMKPEWSCWMPPGLREREKYKKIDNIPYSIFEEYISNFDEQLVLDFEQYRNGELEY